MNIEKLLIGHIVTWYVNVHLGAKRCNPMTTILHTADEILTKYLYYLKIAHLYLLKYLLNY